MTDNQDNLDNLLNKLETLLKRQDKFLEEINELKAELNQLKQAEAKQTEARQVEASQAEVKKEIPEETPKHETAPVKEAAPIQQPAPTSKKLYRDVNHRILGGVCSGLAEYLGLSKVLIRILWFLFTLFFGIGFFIYIILWIAIPKRRITSTYQKQQPEVIAKAVSSEKPVVSDTPVKTDQAQAAFNWEKFIGENLINKIGIAILIIGVGIGVKYSIDNDLISPLTRVILGYLIGLGLLGIGMKLKAGFTNFSSVLVSGAMTILYFITYVSYSLYGLFPQIVTFLLMVLFTVFIIIAALNYNKQIIAHIGLVGAYAVPFLLGDDSGKIAVLLSLSLIHI